LVIIEQWESAANLERHYANPTLAATREALAPLLAGPTSIRVLTPCLHGDSGKGAL
jgi:quinol monooxygenase YgiN